MNKTLLLAIPALTILAIAVGCDQPAPDRKPAADAITAEQPQGGTPQDEEPPAKAPKADVKLPDDLPRDIPVMPGAKPTAVSTPGQTTTVTLETQKPASEVVAYYKQALPANGWQVQASTDSTSGTFIGATKQKRTLNVLIVKLDNATNVKLIAGQ